MHRLIEELKKYHAEKSRVLAVLQPLINDLTDSAKSDTALTELIRLIDSFDSSAEKAHHHNEELILAELQKTDAPIHRRVEEISGDHQAFSKVMARLLDLIEQERDNPQQIALQLAEFKKYYEDHSNTEDLIFFPVADEYLGEKEWERISAGWM